MQPIAKGSDSGALPTARVPLVLLATLALGASLVSCGASGTAGGGRSETTIAGVTSGSGSGAKGPVGRSVHGDADEDDDEVKGDDTTNDAVLDNGPPVGGPVERAVRLAVEGYYSAARKDDGAKACSMMVPSLARALPEDYGEAPGPSYLRGARTCRAILSRLFAHDERQFRGTIEVTVVRARHGHALAILRSKTLPYKYMSLEHQGGRWRIADLLGVEL